MHRTSTRMRLVAFLVTTVGTVAALSCGGGDDELTVFAAVSLRAPLEELATTFESGHDLDVVFSSAGSQRLRFQLEQGAAADVFVSADEAQMRLAEEAGLIEGEPEAFAGNRLAIALPEGDPGAVRSPADLARPGLRLVLAGETVPLGAYTREALDALASEYGTGFRPRVEANVVSREENAEAVLSKLELGEADAAIIYVSDAARLERAGATIVPLPGRAQPEIRYFAAPLRAAPRGEAARAFVELLLSDEGQRVLRQHGFVGVR